MNLMNFSTLFVKWENSVFCHSKIVDTDMPLSSNGLKLVSNFVEKNGIFYKEAVAQPRKKL